MAVSESLAVSEKLAVGILIAVAAWVIQSIVGLLLRRKAIKDALLVDIQSQIASWESNLQFLSHLVDRDLRHGGKIPYSAYYQPKKASLFESLLAQTITHLPDYLARVSKFYASINELEDLMSGFLRDVTMWKQIEHELNDNDIRYLRAKRDRIKSYMDLLSSSKIKDLSDLPYDYRGIQGTEGVTGTIQNE